MRAWSAGVLVFSCATLLTTTARAADGTLRYKDAAGKTLISLRATDKGFRLSDAADQAMGSVKVAEDRVKLKDASDVETRKVKKKPNGAEIEDAAGARLYRLRVERDGAWALVDGAKDALLLTVRAKEGGFEMRKADGHTMAKAKPRDGQVVFETEAGQRLAVLEGTTDARVAVWMAAEPLSLAERAALVAYFQEVQR
jgi:archaeosine-15-forming tRNA-guanine transglycosylase